jgi:hypothetical protein
MRGPSRFRQGDVTKAVKAAKAAGVDVARIEVSSDGKIAIITGKPGEANEANSEAANPWDGVTDLGGQTNKATKQ